MATAARIYDAYVQDRQGIRVALLEVLVETPAAGGESDHDSNWTCAGMPLGAPGRLVNVTAPVTWGP